MQHLRDRLRDRKGTMDLPVKLMITMVIITAFIPVLTNALDENRENMAETEMQQEIEKLKNAAAMVCYSGYGSARTVELDLPAGCEIWIGGEGSDAYSIRSVFNGKEVSKDYFERPSLKVPDEMCINGRVSLKLTSFDCGGSSGLKVTAL